MSYPYGCRNNECVFVLFIFFAGSDMQHPVSVLDRVPLVFRFFKCPGVLCPVIPFGQSTVVVQITVILHTARHIRKDFLAFDPSQ